MIVVIIMKSYINVVKIIAMQKLSIMKKEPIYKINHKTKDSIFPKSKSITNINIKSN